MNFTGERFMPEMISGNIATEHLHRYKAVLEIARGKYVLDAASGEGYGSALLATVAKSVQGIDIDLEAVNMANKKYNASNLQYKCASVTQMPIEDNSIDLVVSFETIEHIDEKMQQEFMCEIKRVLKPDGILIISTPDKKRYSDDISYRNPYHIKEFYFDEFKTFLQEYFSEAAYYLQGLEKNKYEQFGMITDAALPINGELNFVGNCEMYNDNHLYIIAICSNSELENKNSIISMMPDQPGEIVVNNLYIDIANGFCENDKLTQMAIKNEETLKVKFELSGWNRISNMRFDPIEGKPCIIKIHAVRTDIEGVQLKYLNSTIRDDSSYCLMDLDPKVEVHGDFEKATFIEFEYEMKPLSLYEVLDCFHSAMERQGRIIAHNYESKIQHYETKLAEQLQSCDQYMQEIKQLKDVINVKNQEIEQIKSTRGWKILSFLRKCFKK